MRSINPINVYDDFISLFPAGKDTCFIVYHEKFFRTFNVTWGIYNGWWTKRVYDKNSLGFFNYEPIDPTRSQPTGYGWTDNSQWVRFEEFFDQQNRYTNSIEQSQTVCWRVTRDSVTEVPVPDFIESTYLPRNVDTYTPIVPAESFKAQVRSLQVLPGKSPNYQNIDGQWWRWRDVLRMWNIYTTTVNSRSLKKSCILYGGTPESCEDEDNTVTFFDATPVELEYAAESFFAAATIQGPVLAIPEGILRGRIDGSPNLYFEQDNPKIDVDNYSGGETFPPSEEDDDLVSTLASVGWDRSVRNRFSEIGVQTWSYMEYYIADGNLVLHQPSGEADLEFYKVPFYKFAQNSTNTGSEESPSNVWDSEAEVLDDQSFLYYNQYLIDRKHFAFDRIPIDPDTYDLISEERELKDKYSTKRRIAEIGEYPFSNKEIGNGEGKLNYDIYFFTDWGNRGLAKKLATDHGFSFE